MRRDDLAAVEARGLQPRGRRPEPVDDLADQRHRHRPRHHVEPLGGDGATARGATASVPVLGVHDLAAAVEQLAEDHRAVGVGDLGEPREARDAPVVVGRQLVRGVAGGRVDARDLDDDQPDAAARARLLVRDEPVRDQAVDRHHRVVPRRDDAVAQRHRPDAQRREQARERGPARCRRRERCPRLPSAKHGAARGRRRRDRACRDHRPGGPAGAWSGACYRASHGGRAIAARWLGRVAYRDAWDLQKRLAAARADGAIGDQLLLLEHPAVLTLGRQADEAHVLATARRARRAGHRAAARRARRRGDLPRARPAGRLPDPAPRGPRAPPAAVRPGPRGGAHRHVRGLRRRGRPPRRAPGLLGRRPTARRRARSARSGSASSAGWRTTASRSTSDVDLADFDLIDPCGMPGLVSDVDRRRAGPAATTARPRTTSREPRRRSRLPSPATSVRRSTGTCRRRPTRTPSARPSSGSPTPCRPDRIGERT